MNVGVAHSEGNPNTRVMNSRGIWLTYALGVGMLHIVLLSIPFFSVPVVWTLTNVIHNLVSPQCFTGFYSLLFHSIFSLNNWRILTPIPTKRQDVGVTQAGSQVSCHFYLHVTILFS